MYVHQQLHLEPEQNLKEVIKVHMKLYDDLTIDAGVSHQQD